MTGWWMVRCCRGCPEVAARVFVCDFEPGEPSNRMPDRPFIQGQIGLDLVPPSEVWEMVEFCEATPEEQRLLVQPPMSERAPRNGRSAAFTTAPMSKWKQARARRITAAEFEKQVAWLAWASRNAPTHHDYTYRQPVTLAAVPIPRFI